MKWSRIRENIPEYVNSVVVMIYFIVGVGRADLFLFTRLVVNEAITVKYLLTDA